MGKKDPYTSDDIVSIVVSILVPPLGVLMLKSGDPCWWDSTRTFEKHGWRFRQAWKWATITAILWIAGFWICGILMAWYVIYRFHGTHPNSEFHSEKDLEKGSDDKGDADKGDADNGGGHYDGAATPKDTDATDDLNQSEKRSKARKSHRKRAEDESPEDTKLLDEGNEWNVGTASSRHSHGPRVDPQVLAARRELGRQMRAQYKAEWKRDNPDLGT